MPDVSVHSSAASLKSLARFTLMALMGFAATAAPIRFASQTQYSIGDYTNQLAVADFTRDGNLDIAVVSGSGADLAILPGSPTGVFGAPQITTIDYYIPLIISAADFNGDHVPDLALAGSHNINGGTPNGVQAFLGQTSGTLLGQPYLSIQYEVKTMASGQFTSDKYSDLVMTVTQPSGPSGVLVLPGLGNGTFGPEQFTEISGDSPAGFVARDFNGDGYLDLIVSDANSSRVWVLLGEGNGFFQTPIQIALPEKTSAVAAADLNRDGKMDLVVTGTTDIFSLLGNGDGTFQAPQSFAVGKVPRSLVVLDLNCDGIPDVATANYNGPGVTLLQGNGDGTFGAPQFLAAGTEPTWIVAGDFNHDGRPDLAVANLISMTVSVYLNETSAGGAGCKQ